MNYDSDFDRDFDGVWDVDDGNYGGEGEGYYHDDYDVGDFDVDVDISGVDNFHDALDVDIHAGDDLAAGSGGDARDLAAEFGIDGGDDFAAEFGGDDRDLEAEFGIDGGGDFGAEFGGDDRDLAAEFGIDGGDDSDGDAGIAAELGLDDGDYFNEDGDLAAGLETHDGDYDVDGDALSAVEVSSIIGYDFNVDRDFEAEFGVIGGNGDRHLLEAEFELNADDIYDVDDVEATNEEDDDDDDDEDAEDEDVDDDDDSDELVPAVEVDDVISDYYFSGRSRHQHLRVEDLEGEPVYMDDDLDFLLSRGNNTSTRVTIQASPLMNSSSNGRVEHLIESNSNSNVTRNLDFLLNRDNNTSTRAITIQASSLMNSSSNGGVEHLIESNSNPNVRRNQEERDGNSASSSEDTNANGGQNDGVSCPICLEPWTTDGDHIICCLPCGHVYGMSCIKSWLQQPNSGKCPLCNKVCSIEGIRKIYGLTIVTVDKDLKEKIQLLEARCASLELNNADRQRKEAELRQSEAVLLQQPKPDTNN